MVHIRNEDGLVVSIEGGIDANGRIKVDYRSSGGGWGQNLTLAEAAALVKVLNELIEAGHRQVAERYKNAMAALMRAIEDKWDDIDERHEEVKHQPEQRRYLGGICDGIDQAAVLLDHVCERFKLDKPASRSVRARQEAKRGMTEAELLALPEVKGFHIGAIELDQEEYQRRRAAGEVILICRRCDKYDYVKDGGLSNLPEANIVCSECGTSTPHVIFRAPISGKSKRVRVPFAGGGLPLLYSKPEDPIMARTSDGRWWQVGWVEGRRVRMERRPPPNPDSWAESDDDEPEDAFVPPTKDEIAAFASQFGFVVDVEQFWQCYTERDWRLANGAKMRDWQAAVRQWRRTKP